MSSITPLRTLMPGEPLPNPNPNPNPSSSLSLVPDPNANPNPNPNPNPNQVEHPYRFQRTDLWMPAYKWLESLDKDQLVNGDEVSAWLDRNREFRDRLLERHSKYHLTHYIQKLHLKVLKKRGMIPKNTLLSTARASVKTSNSLAIARENSATMQGNSFIRKPSANVLKEDTSFSCKKSEAFARYQLLTDLQKQLLDVLSKHKDAANLAQPTQYPLLEQSSDQASDSDKKEKIMSENASLCVDAVSIHVTKQSKILPALDANSGIKRKRTPVIEAPAWSYCEAFSGRPQCDQPSISLSGEARTHDILKGDAHASSSKRLLSRKNILMCVQGRERGNSWPLVFSRRGYAGRIQEKWIPFFEGWRSLGSQFEGPAAWLSQMSYSSWVPTWCAYTSSVAVAQPHGRIRRRAISNSSLSNDEDYWFSRSYESNIYDQSTSQTQKPRSQ